MGDAVTLRSGSRERKRKGRAARKARFVRVFVFSWLPAGVRVYDYAAANGRSLEDYSRRTRPRLVATLIASVRLVTPSFSKRCPRWLLTVRSLIDSSLAISLFALPS